MQKPPRPPILLSRPTYEWINRVCKKHKQLADLDLSQQQKAALARWVETEFVGSTLALEGMDISSAQVARLASSLPSDAGNLTETEEALTGLIAAFRFLQNETQNRAASLTSRLLLKLHSHLSDSESGFRKTPGEVDRMSKPPPAEHLPAITENACRWFEAESFAELSPIEQASIAHMRLLEIQPFESANQRTALLAASLFTLRRELPPLIIRPDRAQAYRAAVSEGMRMNTTPMVELLAEVIETALGEMIEIISGK